MATPSSSAGRSAKTAAVVAAYLVVTAIMTWPYVSYTHFATALYRGDAELIIWTLAWDNHAVLDGVRLFSSNLFFPAPDTLRYNEHLFGLSLFTLPWRAAGASPVLAHNALWWTAFLLNGLAAFAWLRRFVTSDLAAFAGSLVFAYSFYVMLHAHAHLHLIWIWGLPASLLLFERWFDRPTGLGIAAWTVVVVLQALTSWYLAVMVALANGLLAGVLLWTGPNAAQPRRAWRRRAAHLLGAVAVAGICIGPFARPYVGLRGSVVEAAANAAAPSSYLVPPANTWAGKWWTAHIDDRPLPIWGERTVFLGWTSLTLAALGLAALVTRAATPRRAWVCALLAVVGFLLSLGPSPEVLGGPALAPYAWLSALPGVGGMRAPARFAVLVTLGVAGLAAIGAEALMRTRPTAWRVVAGLVPVMLAEWFVVGFPGGPPAPFQVPAIYRTPEVQQARALLSLPEYREAAEWYLGGDYLYYATAHWRPIVNGFGRSEPPGHADLVSIARRFPASAAELRELGVHYVVLHAGRYPDGARHLLAAARVDPACRVALRIDDDYLIELVAAPRP